VETDAEAAARQALTEMEQRHADERARLEGELRAARAAADAVRRGLLCGTDAEVAEAVSIVLASAGFATEDVDDELGEARGPAVLATRGGHRRLVEISSTGVVLVVDPDHRPPERDDELSVVAARALFDWWRVADWGSIRAAVLGEDAAAAASAAAPTSPTFPEDQGPSGWRSWLRPRNGR
jgi:hypothetical protein